jgi:hypothetical protein
VGFKQMLRRRHINAVPHARASRSVRAVADAARWPFERAAWAVERTVLWPLGERFAGLSLRGRGMGAAALGSLAVAAILLAAILLPKGGSPAPNPAAAPARVADVPAQPEPRAQQRRGPVLQGATPDFHVGGGVGVSKAAGEETAAGDSATPPSEAEAAPEAAPSEEGAGATTSSAKPVPAGPAAMKVARRFSEAFVFYEVGKRPARAKAVFGETATPELAEALRERPPRLPAGAKVPKARVVNLVPGPRDGKAYTVSVSLLRVGLTSELRLSLQADRNDSWKVVDVLG